MIDAQIGLISAVAVAIIAIVGQIVAYKVQRKDSISDSASETKKKICKQLEAIDLKIQSIDEKILNVRNELNEERTIQSRIRILRFADEILQGVAHTKDHFDQILEDITQYERYCDENPDFPNNITVTSTEIIKDHFKKCFKANDFLK